MKKIRRTALGRILLCLAVLVGLGTLLRTPDRGIGPVVARISYGELLDQVRRDAATQDPLARDKVLLGDGMAILEAKGRVPAMAVVPPDARVSDTLTAMGVDVQAVPPSPPGALSTLAGMLPLLLMSAFIAWSIWSMRSGSRGASRFGRSKAARHDASAPAKVMFSDVAGIDEARSELMEIVSFLKDPARFARLGIRMPRGALLVGPPGVGKTMVAKAVASEAGVPFYAVSGSDFVEMFVGVGASRVRDMFDKGRKNSPCIIFIDEIDAMGRKRSSATLGNDEREQTLNQMLVEMDGFGPQSGVVVLAATNRPDVLDAALLRPGRFDRQIAIPVPDRTAREAIVSVHLGKVPLESGTDAPALVREVARGTPGFSGADLANLVNEAGLFAARRMSESVSRADFESARDRIVMGAERRAMVMSDAERRMTAIHEAGHALCAIREPHCDPVHKATILPRGLSLGHVSRIPEEDRHSMSLEMLLADLTMTMGGRCAEELAFGAERVTTGASSDISRATDVARGMVTEWGFSPRLGTVRLPGVETGVAMSAETAALVDSEVRRLVTEASGRAMAHLRRDPDLLRELADTLLEHETLTGDELRSIVARHDAPRA